MVIAGPEDKGKGRAVEEDEAGPEESAAALQPAPDSEAAQAAKAARDRVRLWQRLRLEGLALLVDVLETCKDALGRKRSKKPDDAADAEARLVAIRDDLQQVTCLLLPTPHFASLCTASCKCPGTECKPRRRKSKLAKYSKVMRRALIFPGSLKPQVTPLL
jgi:hypothetical protein